MELPSSPLGKLCLGVGVVSSIALTTGGAVWIYNILAEKR